jgi:hypothetical protein
MWGQIILSKCSADKSFDWWQKKQQKEYDTLLFNIFKFVWGTIQNLHSTHLYYWPGCLFAPFDASVLAIWLLKVLQVHTKRQLLLFLPKQAGGFIQRCLRSGSISSTINARITFNLYISKECKKSKLYYKIQLSIVWTVSGDIV